MKGLTSSDGKMTGNVQMVGSYNNRKGGESGGKHAPEGDDQNKHLSDEYGSAHTVITKKKPEGGFSTESHHEGGAVDHQDHDTLADAHAHGAMAMGEDAETSEMGDLGIDNASERSGIEKAKTKTPSFMD
jgi:hypothetical protein